MTEQSAEVVNLATGASKRLGKNVSVLLKAHGYSAPYLVELLGISRATAYNRIKGSQPFDIEELWTIATRFHVDPARLLKDDSSTLFGGPGPDDGGAGLTLRSVAYLAEKPYPSRVATLHGKSTRSHGKQAA